MLLTEEEAKEKWCPAFQKHGERNGSNRTGDFNTKCLASNCMAWRQVLVRHPRTPDKEEYPGQHELTSQVRGFCGLAGPIE